ncbi:MAG: DUF6020 family protein [Eubacteriales bacterium]
MKELIKCILALIVAWSSAIAVVGVAGVRITQINLLVPILMVAFYFLIRYFRKYCKKREIYYGFGFSIPFAIALVLGGNIDMESSERTFEGSLPLGLLYFCVLAIIGMVAIASIFIAIERNSFVNETFIRIPTKIGPITFGVCMIAWIPYYLTYFPGIISNDALSMIRQCIGTEVLNNHHPILFTLFMKLILVIGMSVTSLNGAVGIFCAVHMVVFAFVVSSMTSWLVKRGANNGFVIVTILYFAFNPAIAIYSVYLTKDIFFSCALLLFMLKLHDIVQSKGLQLESRNTTIQLLWLSLVVIFLRNNGIFIVVGTLLVLLLTYRKEWKRMLFLIILCVTISGVIKGPIYTVIGIPPSSFAESMSIPLQQVGMVIVEDGEMGEEEEAYLRKLLAFEKVKEVYSPGYTDPYKFHEDFDDAYLNETKEEFLQVWGGLLFDYFDLYVEAYLMQTIGYWHIGQNDSLSTYGVLENDLVVEQVNVIENLTGISLEPIIEQLILVVRKAPVICFVTNMAGMMFLLLFLGIISGYHKKQSEIITQLPIWVLWVTLLVAAPAYCKFRYLFILAIGLPYMVYLLQVRIFERRG